MARAPELPRECLRDLIGWFSSTGVRGAVVGGIAVSVLGRPRTTRDVDALIVLDEDWAAFVAAGKQHGFVPRISDALAFASETRMLLMRYQPSSIDVDLMVAALQFERDLVRRAKVVETHGVAIPLPTPADLVVMKAVANRPRDLADIEGILDVHPRLSRARIVRIVAEFAEALDTPELLTDLERIFQKQRGRTSRK